ncbi:MAG: dephospho-CoA kinase [Caulobacteraceae bacterium]
MIILGLTGSIGMGKTTTADMFAQAGAAVFDADAMVHTLYAPGGAAVGPVGEAFPGVVLDGAVDRARLSAVLQAEPQAFKRLEAIVHPLVASHRAGALEQARGQGTRVAVLEVPLLFETGFDRMVEAVVVVSAPASVQMARVMSRSSMDQAKFDLLVSRQLPDADKRARADFVIDTGRGLDAARAQVDQVLATVLDPDWKPHRTS